MCCVCALCVHMDVVSLGCARMRTYTIDTRVFGYLFVLLKQIGNTLPPINMLLSMSWVLGGFWSGHGQEFELA